MKPTNHLQSVKVLAKVYGRDVLTDVKIPKQRRERKKETKPRKSYSREEKKLEKKILLYINTHQHMRGYKMGDMAGTFTYNTHFMCDGMTDLLIVNLLKGKFTWVEVKDGDKPLRKNQEEFKAMCEACGQGHVVARMKRDVYCLI